MLSIFSCAKVQVLNKSFKMHEALEVHQLSYSPYNKLRYLFEHMYKIFVNQYICMHAYKYISTFNILL